MGHAGHRRPYDLPQFFALCGAPRPGLVRGCAMFVSEIAYSIRAGANRLSAAAALARGILCRRGRFGHAFAAGAAHQIAPQTHEARGTGSGAGVIGFQVPMVDHRNDNERQAHLAGLQDLGIHGAKVSFWGRKFALQIAGHSVKTVSKSPLLLTRRAAAFSSPPPARLRRMPRRRRSTRVASPCGNRRASPGGCWARRFADFSRIAETSWTAP